MARPVLGDAPNAVVMHVGKPQLPVAPAQAFREGQSVYEHTQIHIILPADVSSRHTMPVSYTHIRAHETKATLVYLLLLDTI